MTVFLITSIKDKDFTLYLCRLRWEHKICAQCLSAKGKEGGKRWAEDGEREELGPVSIPPYCSALNLSALSYGPVLPWFQWGPNMRWCLSSGDSSAEWERERIWKKLEWDNQQLVTSPDRKQKEKRFPRLVNRTAAVACSRGIATRRAPLTSTVSRSLLMSTESVVLSDHLILCRPLLLSLSVFPRIRIFSTMSALHIRYPKYWIFSFSVQ